MTHNDVRTTFIMPYTQFMKKPYREVAMYFEEVPIELEPFFKNVLMQDDLRFEAEILSTKEVNFTITHSEWGDYDGFVELNGPKVPQAIATMLRRFDVDEYQQWLKEHELSGS
jgi:hypothetical protein